jgi:hypothetical protein
MNENLKPMETEEPNLSNVNTSQEPNLNNVDLDQDGIIRNNASTIMNADKSDETK